jgi:hypothetical protein
VKKLLIALAIIAVIIIIAVVVVFQLTSGIVDVADDFLTEIGEGNLSRAYTEYLSEDFRAATSLEELEYFLNQTALINYSEASWDSRSISGDEGDLEGSVRTSDGGTIPVKFTFVKENDCWKILSIEKSGAGIISDTSSASTPTDEKLIAMANESVYNLGIAVNNRDFTGFYDKIATLWKQQTTPEELQTAFQSFIDKEIDLTLIKDMTPVFDKPPTIDDDGFLILNGYYATQPSVTHFELQYLYEHPDWKLGSISIDIK